MNAEYDKGYQSGYEAGYKRAMLDYGLKDDKPCEDVVDVINELVRHKKEVQNDFGWNITLQKALDAAIEALKCVDDMVEYLTDSTVTWRDISDDCMKDIMEQHRFM